MAKNNRIGLRLSDKTYNAIKEYCKTNNVSQSEYIRELVRQDNEDLTLNKKIENIEYEIKQIKGSIKVIKDRIPEGQEY